MKRSKFTEEQVVEILREAQGGMTVKTVCAKHNISPATYPKWRQKYGERWKCLMVFRGQESLVNAAQGATLGRRHTNIGERRDACRVVHWGSKQAA